MNRELRLSRRSVLTALGGLTAGVLSRRVAAQDEITDADLERASQGRTIRIGTPSTGLVTTLPLEVYIANVLTAESDPRAADASREALAIASRTYTLAGAGRHEREGYDLCDTTHCQVVRPSNVTTRRLTLNTNMQVLTFEERPATLYYSASCGGYSERPADAWPGSMNYPYLQARPDDVHDDEVPWTLDLSMEEADAAMKRIGFRGQLTALDVDVRTSSGRAGTLRLSGMVPDIVGGDLFRLTIGATRVRSTAFQVSSEEQVLRFIGRGYGHGVGMCAVGSAKRALRGESAREILAHYYPGLELVRL